ncbi:glycosyltransferase family 4 protein [Psychrobacillus sp. PGGUH221]|uniref:glycosyltransferase family 4 protein n=1 Tax=Psychrobacillus sp. PGGUH221 TaxID=3020058 RepID=UPI0035C6FD60
MKILFVASVYRHFTAFHIPYMKFLQSKGYEVFAVAAEDGRIKKELSQMGFSCIDIPFSRSPLSKSNIEAYKKLKKLFINEEFKLVHVHTPVASLLTRMAFRHSKLGSVIYTAHGFHFYKRAPLLNWLIYYTIERLAARWTDGLITMNEEDYKRALTMGFEKDAVHYVHGVGVKPLESIISAEEKKELRQLLDLSEDAVVISYVAEINKNKNHMFLLRNWRQIKETAPQAALLLIGDGELKEEIEHFIDANQLLDVRILGYRTDVNDLLGISDIVSLLSHREGLPKSIMEAMSVSIPCVVSDTRGLRDLITHGENGYVIPHGNDHVLVETFISLLNDEEKRSKMGAAGYQNVEPYRLENVLKEYIEIYEDVLGKG